MHDSCKDSPSFWSTVHSNGPRTTENTAAARGYFRMWTHFTERIRTAARLLRPTSTRASRSRRDYKPSRLIDRISRLAMLVWEQDEGPWSWKVSPVLNEPSNEHMKRTLCPWPIDYPECGSLGSTVCVLEMHVMVFSIHQLKQLSFNEESSQEYMDPVSWQPCRQNTTSYYCPRGAT